MTDGSPRMAQLSDLGSLAMPVDFMRMDCVMIRTSESTSKLKGHWTSITSSPNFFQKSWDFYIRSVGMSNNCVLSFTFLIDLLLKKYEYF